MSDLRIPEGWPDNEDIDVIGRTPRTQTREEVLDRVVMRGATIGPNRGVFVVPGPGFWPGHPDQLEESFQITFWQPTPESEAGEEHQAGHHTSHDGKSFLHFALSPEAAKALLEQLAHLHDIQLVPYAHNRE